MTHAEAMKQIDEMQRYFRGCFMNAADGSEAEAQFEKYLLALDIAWTVLNESEDDGK